MSIYNSLNKLLDYGIKNSLIEEDDRLFVRNEFMNLLKLEEWKDESNNDEDSLPEYPQEILDEICTYAVEKNIIEDGVVAKELFDTSLMGKMTPFPREIIKKIRALAKKDIKEATDFYYNFSKKTNYIRTQSTAKNMYWTTETEYGDLEITINLSKPEKTVKEIEMQKYMPASNYPKCVICKENVGFSGNLNKAARQNHRVLPIKLGNENWFMQYSPYVYYNEHAIVFCSEHRDMKINRETFSRLLEFLDEFPHYFIGSNADLKIVGGSILIHDHYQGGNHEFAMAKAKIETKIEFKNFEDVEAGLVKWPMSVIRLKSLNKEKIIELSDQILKIWREYSDEEVEILSHTENIPHNTLTPIARRRGEHYEMDLVLRNNRTNEENPQGIFHSHKKYHNIKRENIGLIEVMGLAVLPGRLKKEMRKIATYLKEENSFEKIAKDKDTKLHLAWVESLCKNYSNISKLTEEEIFENILKKEIAKTFSAVLENSGVYKRNEKGKKAFLKFIDTVNLK